MAVNYTQLEENVLHRVQTVVEKTPNMNDSVLMKILRAVKPDPSTDISEFNMTKVESRIRNWWAYVGQWAFKPFGISKDGAEKFAKNTVEKHLPDPNVAYPSYKYAFNVDADLDPWSDVTDVWNYGIEVRPTKGKSSLWPRIYPCNDFKSYKDMVSKLGLKDKDFNCCVCRLKNPTATPPEKAPEKEEKSAKKSKKAKEVVKEDTVTEVEEVVEDQTAEAESTEETSTTDEVLTEEDVNELAEAVAGESTESEDEEPAAPSEDDVSEEEDNEVSEEESEKDEVN